ncbi:VOC family protein [Mesorhizobium sp. WSM4906]|uniref:VOC family protein n=1 Tax=Mesorhizobium sp. WSM4906 TaxID=3038546 RepID=UPI002417E17C|nr:VOC family protein [Mesorhizobium sp. WSM4906]WFP76859.1 VOC family protein [Mesorhizobium sp. WSM4906]
MPFFNPPQNGSSPFKSMRGDHAGLRVADLDAALRWYQDALDFRHTRSIEAMGLTFAFIAPPNDNSFEIEIVAGLSAVDRPKPEDLHATLGLHGWHHLCFHVDSVDDAVAELRRRGVDVIAGSMDFSAIQRRGAFFLDPWGNLFELNHSLSA